jgi:hypothetical protein
MSECGRPVARLLEQEKFLAQDVTDAFVQRHGWISLTTMHLIDRFNAVHAHGRTHVEQLVRAQLGI